MRKVLFLALSAVGASLLALSCVNDEFIDPQEEQFIVPEGTEAAVVAKAGLPEYEEMTKVEFGAGDAQTWAASGETLTVIPSAGSTSFFFTGGGTGTSASFDGYLGSSPSGDYFAVYPSTVSLDPGAVLLDNSEVQDGTASQKTFMWGRATYSAGGLDFGDFSHLGSVMKLGLDFSEATSVAADSQISFTLTLYNVTTSVTVNLNATPDPAYSAETKGDLTVNVSDLQLDGKRGYVYIRLLPGDAMVNKAVKVVVNTETLSCYVNSGSSPASALPVTFGKLYRTNKNLALAAPFFYGSAEYGVYDLNARTALWTYTPFSDQIQRETSSTAYTFRLVNPGSNQYVEVGDLPNVMSVSDISMSVNHNCLNGIATSSTPAATVYAIDGSTVWILDENNIGYIIKK